MTYEEYIRYHLGGDAGVEERMIASLSAHFGLSRWDSFRLAYYYTTTYHIPSALKLLRNHSTPKSELKFRTDRRYVRIGDNFNRIMAQLSPKLLEQLDKATTTTEQYDIVSSWYFFGRYAAFLFLEVWAKLSGKQIKDDLALKFEPEENYTRGAEIIAQTQDKAALSAFIERAKFEGMTMADYMRWLWNNPQNGQSPYKLFEGALVPIDKDLEGNLIYKFNGARF